MKLSIPNKGYLEEIIQKDSRLTHISRSCILVDEGKNDLSAYNIEITVELPSVADKEPTIQASYSITSDSDLYIGEVKYYPLSHIPYVFADIRKLVEEALNTHCNNKMSSKDESYSFGQLASFLSRYTLDWAQTKFSCDSEQISLTISCTQDANGNVFMLFDRNQLEIKTKQISASLCFTIGITGKVEVGLKTESCYPSEGFEDGFTSRISIAKFSTELLEIKNLFIEISTLSNIADVIDCVLEAGNIVSIK